MSSSRVGGWWKWTAPAVLLTATVVITAGSGASNGTETYDLVIAHGRVMDPESGLDAVRNMGIRGGKIAVISTGPLEGKQTMEARGLVVAPGFIDLHQHGQDAENYAVKAADGVTTALELEVGVADVDRGYEEREGKALINYGASVGHIAVRMAVMHDPGGLLPSGDAAHRVATTVEREEISGMLEKGLKRGALSLGLGPAYTEAATNQEILDVFRLAAKYHASCHVHIRASGPPIEGNFSGFEEVIAADHRGFASYRTHTKHRGTERDAGAADDHGRALPWHGRNNRKLSLHHGYDQYSSCHVRSQGRRTRHVLRFALVAGDGGAPDEGVFLRVPQTRRNGDCSREYAGECSCRGGESADDDRERWISFDRAGTSANRGHLRAGSGTLRAGRKGPGFDDRSEENDADARAAAGKASADVQGERADSRGGGCRHYGVRRESRH